jgi:uncharacterized protein YuzE
MKISYDSEIDALYIKLVEGNQECRTLQLTEEIALNIGQDELLVGIEILDAKEILALVQCNCEAETLTGYQLKAGHLMG